MKKVAAVLALSLMIGMPAMAGTITFTPQGPTDLGGGGPTSVDFIVGYSGDFSAGFGPIFTAIVQDIGVNGGPRVSFEFNGLFLFDPPPPGEFLPIPVFNLSSVNPSTAFDSAVQIQAVSAVDPPNLGRPLPWDNVGTLTIDVDGVNPGQFDIQVLGGIGNPSGLIEDAFGTASFTVVPEPATISLLALGALGLLRRRKTA